MRRERVTLTALEIDGRPVRLAGAELVWDRRTSPADGLADWVIAGVAEGPTADGADLPFTARAGRRSFSGRAVVSGVPAPVRHSFEMRGSDGRELEEAGG